MMKKTNFRKLRLGRLTIGVFICILMLSTSVATTLGNFINSDENNSNSLSYTFLFKEPVFKSIHQDSSEYTLIDIQGCMAVSSQAGEPQIPIKTITLLLPPKKTVSSINVVGTPVQIQSPINLIEKPVFPYQNSVPFGIDITHEFQINSNIYSSNNPYPSNTFSDYNIGYSHGYAILNFGLNPLQYTPSQGTIIFYPEITVTINLEDNDYTGRVGSSF